MSIRSFLNFVFLTLHGHRASHGAVFLLSVLLVTITGSVLFLSRAIQSDLQNTIASQPDLVVQKIQGGQKTDLPVSWAEDFTAIAGVSQVQPRIYGRYFHEPNGAYFTIVGLDLFEDQVTDDLQVLVEGLDLRQFLSRPSMIVGPGVRSFMSQALVDSTYTFKTPEAKSLEVLIVEDLPEAATLVGNDLVFMEMELARQILGLKPGTATDLALAVPNELEGDAVMGKLILLHYDIRVIQKKELTQAYQNLFHFKGGVFLVLWLVCLTAFVLILFQRYSQVSGAERREVGILRATGWSIRDVLILKVAENGVVALAAWLAGITLAYFNVFMLGAPGLKAIFLGHGNLPISLDLSPAVTPGSLVLLFLFFLGPYLAAILIPVWRIAVLDPTEVMK